MRSYPGIDSPSRRGLLHFAPNADKSRIHPTAWVTHSRFGLTLADHTKYHRRRLEIHVANITGRNLMELARSITDLYLLCAQTNENNTRQLPNYIQYTGQPPIISNIRHGFYIGANAKITYIALFKFA